MRRAPVLYDSSSVCDLVCGRQYLIVHCMVDAAAELLLKPSLLIFLGGIAAQLVEHRTSFS